MGLRSRALTRTLSQQLLTRPIHDQLVCSTREKDEQSHLLLLRRRMPLHPLLVRFAISDFVSSAKLTRLAFLIRCQSKTIDSVLIPSSQHCFYFFRLRFFHVCKAAPHSSHCCRRTLARPVGLARRS